MREGKNKRAGSDNDVATSSEVYGQVHGDAAHGSFAQGGYYDDVHSGEPRQSQQYSTGSRRQNQGYGEQTIGGGYQQGLQDYGHSGDSYGGGRQEYQAYGSGYGRDPGASYDRSGYEEKRRLNQYEESHGSSRQYGVDSYSTASRSDAYGHSGYGQQESPSESGYAPSYQPVYVAPSEPEGYGESHARRDDQYGPRGGYNPRSEGYDRYDGSQSYGFADASGYGSQRRQEYGQANAGYGDEDGGYRRDDDDGEGRHHRRHRHKDNEGYGESGYDNNEDQGRGGSYGGGYGEKYAEYESRGSYGGGYGEGGYGEGESRGYGGGYGDGESRGYGGDDTFGAERLTISDEG